MYVYIYIYTHNYTHHLSVSTPVVFAGTKLWHPWPLSRIPVLMPVSVKKHSSREEGPWGQDLSRHHIWGRRAVFDAGSYGKGSRKRSMFVHRHQQTPVRHVWNPKCSVAHMGDWVTGFSGKAPYRDMRGFAGSGKATAIWSFRHCEPAACILCLAGANMRLSLICGFP